jgi:hypothetical protein
MKVRITNDETGNVVLSGNREQNPVSGNKEADIGEKHSKDS